MFKCFCACSDATLSLRIEPCVPSDTRRQQVTHCVQDPSCKSYSQALLYFKGYHAIQLYRFAHELWKENRRAMAMSLQSRLSEVRGVTAVFQQCIICGSKACARVPQVDTKSSALPTAR